MLSCVQAMVPGTAGAQFKRHVGAPAAGKTPWRQGGNHLAHPAVAVDEDDVDGVMHEGSVNRRAGAQQQGFIRRQWLAPEQTAQARPPARRHFDVQPGSRGGLRWIVNGVVHSPSASSFIATG